jgi:3-deoxy-D-manno-octulosonate 8-phosphate phosphatase (KDO 8-P phosphatase)
MKNFKELLTGIRFFIFDIDGVLTDGTVTLLPDGEMVRSLSVRDAFAIQLAIQKGFRVAIISGAKSDSLKSRLTALGITDLYLNAQDKKDAFDEFILTYNIPISDILIMGDDLPDYEIMKRCELRTCPADAAPEIRSMCQYVSPKKGGQGCVRDVIEQVLKSQGKWFSLT